jgi:hypothetical protein
MIDFRFHLISIIAVLLALSIGIVTGSGFLGGRLLQEVRSAARRVSDRNQALRLQNAEITERADAAEAALEVLEPGLVDGALVARRVLVIEFEGSDDNASSEVRAAIEEAGAQVMGIVRLRDTLALDDPNARAELESMLGSSGGQPEELRLALADTLGRELNAAARHPGAQAALADLLAGLQRSGLVAAENLPEVVPSETDFVVSGGAVADPAWPIADFTVALSERLAARETGVVVIEPAQSTWDLTGAVRRDGSTRTVVWTVDNSDTVLGRMASVLVLEQVENRPADHFGTAPGASAVVPSPAP